jgi:para-nitrobenzyl esterase
MGTTTVETRDGRLEGKQVGSVLQWRGVPFAAPPVGPLRFMPPQPPAPWAGVRDATRFASPSAQPASPMEAMFGAGGGPLGEEDCLYLNVFAPAEPKAERLPVMCWIHGGSFTGGSGSTPWYDGGRFAGSGRVVVVTINYRLGALGFSHFGEAGGEALAVAGNCGVLDQVAALGWIRDNIELFGGDPGRVTVFGESAGSMSIATLLGLPAAKGLFHQAILQSGATNVVRSAEKASGVTAALLAALGCSAKELAEAPVGAILEAQKAVSASQGASSTVGMLAFAPVVDGTSLPRHPLEAIREGAAAGVRTVIGTNHDEATLFIGFDPKLASMDREALGRRLSRLAGEDWPRFAEGYGAARPGASPFELLAAALTDYAFRIPAIELASAQVGAGAEVWMYRFDWPSAAFGGRLRATHALELPFVWDILGTKGVSMFTGEGAPAELAQRMHADWLAFACGAAPEWPPYDVSGRATMIYDTECRVVEDPDGAERALWISPA